MTIAERINLHRCGYSRAEIDALAREEREQITTVEAEPIEPADPAQDPAPNNEPNPTQDHAPNIDSSADNPIIAELRALRQAIQASNINNKEQPEQPKETTKDLVKYV